VTYVVRINGKEAGRFKAAEIIPAGSSRFIFTLKDSDGRLVGSFYLSTEPTVTWQKVEEQPENS
jgi:hypothetical protein